MLGLVVMGVLVASLVSWLRQSSVPVFTVTSATPAYHVLAQRDLHLTSIRVRHPSRYARYPIEGRVLQRALTAGAPVERSDLLPDMSGQLHGPIVVTALQTAQVAALGTSLSPGDEITLIVNQSGQGKSIPVVVVDIAKSVGNDARPYALVVALLKTDAESHAAALAGSGVLIVRRIVAPSSEH